MAQTIALLGSLDTKGTEYDYVRQCLLALGHTTLLIDVGVLGPPAIEPDDAAFILQRCAGIDGFYGASSMERLPTERAIREQTQRFMQIRKEL